MKKILAVLLALLMVLPMCLVAQAGDVDAEVKPYQFVNWSEPLEELSNFWVMPKFWCGNWQNPGVEALAMSYTAKNTGSDISEIAAAVKEVFDEYPDGARYINFPMLVESQAELVVYLDKGTKLVKDWLEEFLSEYKALGGKLDGLIFDVEYTAIQSYYISQELTKDPLLFDEIVKDPRYATEIRPLLEERGFKFYEDVTEYTPEIYSAAQKSGDEYALSRSIWDTVMRNRVNAYITEASSPLEKYYPDAYSSNYCHPANVSWVKTISDLGGVIGSGGNSTYAGNTSNENTYLIRPAADFYTNLKDSTPTLKKPVNYYKTYLPENKFSMFLWDMHIFKNMYASSDNNRISVWFAGYNYHAAVDREASTAKSPYYAETLFHIGLMDPQPFIGYILPRDCGLDYDVACQIVSDAMSELTRVVGYADRKYIYTPHEWNSSFALTGMYAGGRNVWRITPDLTDGMTLEAFKVEGKDPTFSINGQTVTFPGGKIIEDGKITEIGSCGYWVETPDDVMPIVTSDADRYSKYPAYGVDFEDYKVGDEFNYNSAKPVTSWEVKKGKGATALIQADKENADNQVLAITGTYSLKNARVTEKVTAADSYAKGQAWEITVTVPADMAADAEIVLLNINNEKGKELDGGFKIAGGKLYYDNAGEYVEVAGVDMSAGGKFTFKRNMDFYTEGAFTTDYLVYNAAGEQVLAQMDVPVAADVKIPVVNIGLTCTNIAGEAVLFDDYKLYASGVAADFELYDAKTGMKVTDMETAREADTAYRLSWMNATSSEKAYSIVAAYYEGDKLVEEKVLKEIKMAPNTDGVETAVVAVESGKAVRIYARNDSKTEDSNTGTDGGDIMPGNDGGSNMLTIIIIAVVAVLAIAAVVVVLLVMKKKKAAAPAAEAEEAAPAEEAEEEAAPAEEAEEEAAPAEEVEEEAAPAEETVEETAEETEDTETTSEE